MNRRRKDSIYNARDIEHGTFTPIVIIVKGVMGHEGHRYHKTLAEKVTTKTGEKYEDVTRLIQVKISFIVLRAALLYL